MAAENSKFLNKLKMSLKLYKMFSYVVCVLREIYEEVGTFLFLWLLKEIITHVLVALYFFWFPLLVGLIRMVCSVPYHICNYYIILYMCNIFHFTGPFFWNTFNSNIRDILASRRYRVRWHGAAHCNNSD